ncbi:hypothetical protein C7974DRAFT_185977 [Boeremia exigua]|uniref:uncharacterized protein n=1 Tax=Boeremia exigua TaxID=749465 RepID=UPI001E8D3B01|nr:uncharacterized protein C7974DRAFT_185977 [Boeremia exigua]KAH6629409.1 hypothetical protein C7974DRAFT_185977 [Boeremia exigua]
MSNPYRRTIDPATRPPSTAPDIPVVRASKSDSSKASKRRRVSFSTSAFRDVPKTTLDPSHALARDRQETNIEPPQPRMCESCEGQKSPVWNCSYCDTNYCDDCWDKQGPHRAGKTGPDGLPHEKANPTIVKRLHTYLSKDIVP